jgi:hypothetical protein
MRRWWLLLIVGLVAAVGATSALWPARAAPAFVEPEAPLPPQFHAVDVRATGARQALTLTGVVREPGGKPIAGAEVFLAASSQASLVGVRCGVCNERLLSCHAHETARSVAGLLEGRRGELVPALTARSDAEGRFRFEQLAGTSFTVWGRAAGFGDGVKERAAPGDPVELFLPLPRALAGRLRDEASAPVRGTVRVTSRRLARVLEVNADAEGRFVVEGLGEGPFAVSAAAPGKLPALEREAEAGAAPLTLTLAAPRRLEVRVLANGEPADAVLTLEGDHLTRQLEVKGGFRAVDELYPGELMVAAAQGALSTVPRRVTLSGPVTEVTLNLERGGTLAVTVSDEVDQPVVAPVLELLTRAMERVTTKKAQTGELVLFGPLGAGEYVLRAAAVGYQPATLPVQVRAGAEGALTVTLTKGTVISGRVIDEYGRPAGGISVLVTPTGDSIFADGEGRFVAPVPSPGLYALHAHHSDWGGGDLKVTAPAADVELQLEPRAGAEVTVMAEGRRVEGASVALFHAEGNFRSDRSSGADGVVLMRGLPPDSYTLIAMHPDFLPSERQMVELKDGDLKRLTVELKPGARLEGQVVDTQGAPVPGVMVTVMPRGAEPAVTDAEGRFTLSPLRPSVGYVLRVTQRGIDQQERVVGRAGGEPVRIVVRRQSVFHGRVLGSDGQALKNFRVDQREVTSPDGRFELPLPATEDRVIVTLEAPGYEPMVANRPNTPDLGDFTLDRAPQVTGVVKEEGGGPVVDAVVSCDTCEQSVMTEADGRFMLGRPAFQREFTVVAKKGKRTATKTVTDGVLQGLELVLKPSVHLTGVAYLPSGQPAAGLEIAGVHVDRGDTASVVTNADGTYALDVPPGLYRFMLALPPSQSPSEDPPALLAELSGTEARLDFGPVPGLATLAVRLTPRPGAALWLVRGELQKVGNPPMELLRLPWAQLVYQPRSPRVVLGGLAPGRYTLVWASFHAAVPTGPVIIPVSVPAGGEIVIP